MIHTILSNRSWLLPMHTPLSFHLITSKKPSSSNKKAVGPIIISRWKRSITYLQTPSIYLQTFLTPVLSISTLWKWVTFYPFSHPINLLIFLFTVQIPCAITLIRFWKVFYYPLSKTSYPTITSFHQNGFRNQLDTIILLIRLFGCHW